MEAISSEGLTLPPLPHAAAALLSASSSVAAPQQPTDALRLQHLYTLALADRMRMLHPAGGFNNFAGMFLPGSSAQLQAAAALTSGVRFSPPSDLARFPLAKLDPRLFRIPFPEEPKPQHSYIGLIAMSILSSGDKKLVLADIYQYILDNFPYFRHRGPGWRNSIRHNLSLNDCFIKAGRASNGKGHFWAVHPACQEDFQKGDFSRRKAQRKVRKYLGMSVGMDDEDTPPSSPVHFQFNTTTPTTPVVGPFDALRDDFEGAEMKPSALHLQLDMLQRGAGGMLPTVVTPAPCSPSSSISAGASPPRSTVLPASHSPPVMSSSPKLETVARRNISFGIDSLLRKDDHTVDGSSDSI